MAALFESTEPTQSSSSPSLTGCLEHADEDIFPNIRTLLRIGCTLPVGSCEAELPATGQNLPRQQDGGRSAFWAHRDEHEPRPGD